MNVKQIILISSMLLPLNAYSAVFADASGIDGSNYFGVSALGIRYHEDLVDFHDTGFALIGGHEFNDYFGVEGRVGTGLTGDKISGIVDVGVDYLVSIFARASIFLWDPHARLYVLAGMTHGKLTAEAFGLSSSLTDSELGYGLGFEFFGDNRNAVNLEFIRYIDGEDQGIDYNVDAFSIGYTHRF